MNQESVSENQRNDVKIFSVPFDVSEIEENVKLTTSAKSTATNFFDTSKEEIIYFF